MRGLKKTAAIYSPTLQQYHRRGQAYPSADGSEWEEVEPSLRTLK